MSIIVILGHVFLRLSNSKPYLQYKFHTVSKLQNTLQFGSSLVGLKFHLQQLFDVKKEQQLLYRRVYIIVVLKFYQREKLINIHRYCLSSWFTCSVCSSVQECQAVDDAILTLSNQQSFLVKSAMNCDSWSKTTQVRRLWSFQI